MERIAKTKSSSKRERRSRDPEATKAEILDAAEEEFAKHGLSGARTDAIASRTGVTKAMIYYYFQNKEGLYRAVMQRVVAELRDTIRPAELDKLPAEEALKTLVRGAIAYEASNPHRGMLWFHEAIQNQGKYGELTGWQETFKCIVKILERGMARGSFRKLDPFLAAINIIAVCVFYFDARENLKSLAPERELLSAEMVELQTQQAIDFIMAGVAQN